ncbi:RNA 3'-terminal phosphate cyclase, partial [Blattella germanica]
LEIVRDVSGGKLKGGDIGSTEIVLHPGKEYKFADPSCFAVFTLWQWNDNSEVERGYYPRGGGEVHIRVNPTKQLNAINLVDSGNVVRIWGWSFVAGSLPIKVAHLMADGATQTIRRSLRNVDVKIERYKEDPEVAVGNGSGIILVSETSAGCLLGGCALGRRELKAEQVGQNAADELLQSINCGACVDSYSQDQMIIFMAIAHGKSRVKCGPVTLHTKTAIHVAEELTEAKFNIINEGPESYIIECEGIGLKNSI